MEMLFRQVAAFFTAFIISRFTSAQNLRWDFRLVLARALIPSPMSFSAKCTPSSSVKLIDLVVLRGMFWGVFILGMNRVIPCRLYRREYTSRLLLIIEGSRSVQGRRDAFICGYAVGIRALLTAVVRFGLPRNPVRRIFYTTAAPAPGPGSPLRLLHSVDRAGRRRPRYLGRRLYITSWSR